MLKEFIAEETRCRTLERRTLRVDTGTGECEVAYELLRLERDSGVYILCVSTDEDFAAECISSDAKESERIFNCISNALVTPCGLYDTLHNLKNSI